MHLLPRLPPLPKALSLSGACRDAFAEAAVFPLKEFRADAGAAAGTVRAGWRGSALCLLADLERRAPSTRSTADRQPLWQLGDCFEIFLKRLDAPPYLELHVSPAGHMLALRFPGPRTPELRRLTSEETVERLGLFGKRFECAAEPRPDGHGWTVVARIDLAALGLAAGDLAGERFAFLFGSCDFTVEPIRQSSSSEMERTEVHLQSQWRQGECADGAA